MHELNQTYKTDEWRFAITGHTSNLMAVKIKGGVFVAESMLKTQGGLLKGLFVIENNRITDASLSGDITIYPITGLITIEEKLKGMSVDKTSLNSLFEEELIKEFDFPGLSKTDFVNLVLQAALSHKEARL